MRAPGGSAGRGWRWVRWLPVGAAALLAVEAAFYLTAHDWIQVHAEGGPIEVMQIAGWGLGALLAGALALGRRGADRLLAGWVLVVGALATARELDLHEWLNPDHIGRWGVSFRADWWLSMDSAPLLLKAGWAAGFAVLALALLGPLLALWRPGLRLLAGGDASAGLLAGAALCMGCGYVSDDLLRHAGLPVEPLQGIEETLELLGAAAFLASVGLLARAPMRERLARLDGVGGESRYRETR